MSRSVASDIRHSLFAIVFVVCLALAMGLPTIRGGFVGGDDHRLVHDHVLVNHPSFAHAIELFTIRHRDLYQPLPLLSFSMEFAVGLNLGLFEGGRGAEAGAWLFHLDNALLHALNAALVWLLLARVQRSRAAATIVAILFAIHPLQAEVIAWLNGRMMLLSTLFALACLLSFSSWLDRSRKNAAILTVLFALLCAISKVRIALPFLLLIVAVAKQSRFNRRLWLVWIPTTALTAGFVLLNIWTTSKASLFSAGAEALEGPPLVRVLLALAFYFQHLVWPAGLGSFYPAPVIVHWSDPATWRAVVIVAAAAVVIGGACWRWRQARWGLAWFAVTIASTLPFVPARNTLAADRYMYLPIIGLAWLAAVVAYAGYERVLAGTSPARRRGVVALLGVLVVTPFLGIGWKVGSFYATPVEKTGRIARLHPDTPRVWCRLGWAHYEAGKKAQAGGEQVQARKHFAESLACARKELDHDDASVRGEAYRLTGMTQYQLGEADAAIASLQRAIELDPKSGAAKYRLATIYDDLGQLDQALHQYEAAVDAAPSYNVAIIRLAKLYRRLHRVDAARVMYGRALDNNPYELGATLGLAEMDIAESTPQSLALAVERLTTLLDWMPEHVTARVNLGVALAGLGRYPEAIATYEQALAHSPSEQTATLNLALLYDNAGQSGRALALLDGVASPRARALHAWLLGLAGRLPEAQARAMAETLSGDPQPLSLATLAYVALEAGDYEAAVARSERLAAAGPAAADARHRLLSALQEFEQRHPEVPWTYFLVARLLLADGQLEAAGAFIELFEKGCDSEPCRAQARRLRDRITDAATPDSR